MSTVSEIPLQGVQTEPGLLTFEDLSFIVPDSTPSDGLRDRWSVGDVFESPVLYVDEGQLSVTEPRVHYARETSAPDEQHGSIMTMAQWLALEEVRPQGNFWVLDDDGWFYFAVPLSPPKADAEGTMVGGATSLLLESIEVNDPYGEEVEYAIEVEADFFTIKTLDDLTPEASENAIDLLRVTRYEIEFDRGFPINIETGDELQIDATLWQVSWDGVREIVPDAVFEWELEQATDYSQVNNRQLKIGYDEFREYFDLTVRAFVGPDGNQLRATRTDNRVNVDAPLSVYTIETMTTFPINLSRCMASAQTLSTTLWRDYRGVKEQVTDGFDWSFVEETAHSTINRVGDTNDFVVNIGPGEDLPVLNISIVESTTEDVFPV